MSVSACVRRGVNCSQGVVRFCATRSCLIGCTIWSPQMIIWSSFQVRAVGIYGAAKQGTTDHHQGCFVASRRYDFLAGSAMLSGDRGVGGVGTTWRVEVKRGGVMSLLLLNPSLMLRIRHLGCVPVQNRSVRGKSLDGWWWWLVMVGDGHTHHGHKLFVVVTEMNKI